LAPPRAVRQYCRRQKLSQAVQYAQPNKIISSHLSSAIQKSTKKDVAYQQLGPANYRKKIRKKIVFFIATSNPFVTFSI
jgi:hypothetical protein